MKRALIITNVLTLVLLYMSSFKDPQKEKTPPVSCTPICIDYTQNPITGITPNTAKSMAAVYRGNQMKTLNAAQGFDETRSVWFSLDKLKSFIGELESKVCDANCPSTMYLGVRIYEGAYPDLDRLSQINIKQNTGYFDVDNRYSKHLTMFMVPTYFDRTENSQIDFDPRNIGTNPCKPLPLKNVFTKTVGDAGMSPADRINYNKFNVEPEVPQIQSFQRKPNGGSPQPIVSKSLILSAIENQVFYKEKGLEKSMMKKKTAVILSPQSIINHGNTIPPDVDGGAAF